MLANRTAKMKSAVWDSFTKIDATTARCQICTKILKHTRNTTNLMQHLVREHPASIAAGSKQKTGAELNTVDNKRKRGMSENEEDPPPKNADSQMRRNISVSYSVNIYLPDRTNFAIIHSINKKPIFVILSGPNDKQESTN